MSDLWNMSWQAQLIGLDITGALQRNNVLDSEETGKLEDWVFQICFTISMLLEGQDIDLAFEGYYGKHSRPEDDKP